MGALTSVASLGTAHWYAFPAPAQDDGRLRQAISEARRHGEKRVLLHVLYGECACSRRVFDHLLARRALPNAAETVVLVDGDAALEARLIAAGFRVQPTRADELEARFGVSAAPLLVIALDSDEALYVGGYTARKQSLDLADQHILALLEQGVRPEFLPLFGCPVSERLQRMLDPFGFKYGATRTSTRP